MKISIENPESKQYEEKQLISPIDELNKIMNFHHPLDYMLNEVDGDAIHYHYETIGEIFPKEFAYIETALKALETIKEYFILTSEYGKISFELKKVIPEEKYDLLKKALLYYEIN